MRLIGTVATPLLVSHNRLPRYAQRIQTWNCLRNTGCLAGCPRRTWLERVLTQGCKGLYFPRMHFLDMKGLFKALNAVYFQ